jgi:hypothetical protein
MSLASRCHSTLKAVAESNPSSVNYFNSGSGARKIHKFKFSLAAQGLTPELTGRALSADRFKLTMKAPLFALRFNE